MQLSPYRALARFAAAAGAGGKIGSAQKENRKTPDGRPHAHAVQQKETSEPGARFASRLSPQCVRPMRTPRCKRGRCDKRDLRARGAMCVQAQPGRGEETRTPDILLPKQARYQLRYTSEKELLFILPSFAPEVKKIPQNSGFAGEVPFFHLLCPFFYFPEQVYGAIISAEQAAVRRAAGKRNHKRQKSV